MALTPDLSEKQLDIFRSKVCQRMSRDGVCQWKSKCQFSHSTDWPRRPPRKHRYSPELCPSLFAAPGVDGQVAQLLVGKCSAGRSCQYAHSAEEVLYHPAIYKTVRCEDFAASGTALKNARGTTGKKRCPRYYCPFAHGELELRATTLHPGQVKMCLTALEVCPLADGGRGRQRHASPSNPQEGGSTGPLPPGALDETKCMSLSGSGLGGSSLNLPPRSVPTLQAIQQLQQQQQLQLLLSQQMQQLAQQQAQLDLPTPRDPLEPPLKPAKGARDARQSLSPPKEDPFAKTKDADAKSAKQSAAGQGEGAHTILATNPSSRPWSERWAVSPSAASPFPFADEPSSLSDLPLPMKVQIGSEEGGSRLGSDAGVNPWEFKED
eukprot:CAMPEP_0178424450 /NCGR_PEP_ID=MMETSP0689_2-20121128/28215_1 /TAXON_ID=160604 /ORGANISM="Amphidinium massartii, Strain CS-259" /LENGTH=378 /DNA_ID=CAMNT_0020046085 /DNA_START=7 /DNA_END=1140 /DNA_ORIENTATION=+